VVTVLWYGVGAAHEEEEIAGVAHFLEHMMFKGSRRYGPGEVDRKTQALGGSNNAFTGYDATAYYFSFAGDRWTEALDIEADRMAGLTLDPEEVDRERRVILEELSMYEEDPWDSLEFKAHRKLYGGHPYGRRILGTRESLRLVESEVLREHHRRSYRPGNGVLVVAGDIDRSALEQVERCFGHLPVGLESPRPETLPPVRSPEGLLRIVQHKGDTPRILLLLPAPPAASPDYAPLRLLLTVLAGGRASRLQRKLIDEEQICSSISAGLTETVLPSAASIAAEVMPGVEPQRAEERILDEVERLESQPPTAKEVERARAVLLSDWVFSHERIDQRAFLAGLAETLFDSRYPLRHLERLGSCLPSELPELVHRYLRPKRSGVLAWSLPEADREAPGVQGGDRT
jgi:zinc protease